MKQENKTKSVKKFSVKMLLAMVFGGVLGGFFGVFNMEPFCSVSMLFHRYSAFFFLQMDTR